MHRKGTSLICIDRFSGFFYTHIHIVVLSEGYSEYVYFFILCLNHLSLFCGSNALFDVAHVSLLGLVRLREVLLHIFDGQMWPSGIVSRPDGVWLGIQHRRANI